MKLGPVLLAFISTAALAQAKKKHAKADSSGAGGDTHYEKERAAVYETITFNSCVKDPSPAKFDRFGCCPDPTSLPQFAKGWTVQIETPLDDMCISPSAGEGLEVKFKVVAATGKEAKKFKDGSTLFYINQYLEDPKAEAIQQAHLDVVCMGAGETQTLSFSATELLKDRTGKHLFDNDEWWQLEFTPLPTSEQLAKKTTKPSWLDYGDPKGAGGPWFSNDCSALADKIRAGKVKYPPKNRFALNAIGGKKRRSDLLETLPIA